VAGVEVQVQHVAVQGGAGQAAGQGRVAGEGQGGAGEWQVR